MKQKRTTVAKRMGQRMASMPKQVLAASLAVALLGGGGAAYAGKVYVSGQDSDDSGHVSLAFGTQLLNFINTGNTNGGSNLLVLGGNAGQTAFNTVTSWNTSAISITHADDAADIAAAAFNNFAGILILSAETQTGGGLSQLELNAINTRSGDVASFVNGGGNLMAFTEQGLTNAFGWFPLGTLITAPIGTANISQTAELAAAGFTATNAEISGDLYHNEFTGPAGFFGLKVLAINNNTGEATILGGGSATVICGGPNGPACGVPEPGSLALIAASLASAGLGLRRRERGIGSDA